MSGIGTPIETESRLVVAKGWEEGGIGSNSYQVYLWGDENILELDRGGGCTTL